MQGVKKYKNSFFYSPIWVGVLIVISVILLISVINMYRKFQYAKKITIEYQQDLNQIQKGRIDLEKNIENLSTERGRENEIRDRYRVVRQGEQMIIIIDNTKEEDSPDNLDQVEIRKKTTFFDWVFAIFKKN